MKSAITLAILVIASTLFGRVALAELVIADRAEAVDPVRVGEKAPAFTVREVDGSDYHFDPDGLDHAVLLITFRGGWCPYCNTHLNELRHVVPELTAQGYEVLFLSADRPEILYSSLKDENQNLDYRILSDSRMEASSALGIAHRNTEGSIRRLADRGTPMEIISGETHYALPVPSVFLIDADGTIRFAHVDPDYRKRLSAEEIRAAVQNLEHES